MWSEWIIRLSDVCCLPESGENQTERCNMKKKIAVMLAGTAVCAMVMTGCSSNEASNDYVTVVGYKGIEVDKVDEAEEVTDESVENYINAVLAQNATEEEITDRPVESGDTVNINFVGKQDGVEFDGGTAENYALTIGSGSFIDGFEDSVIGHNIGDTYDWNGKFPDDYSNNPDLAGKDVVFTITVNSISKSTTPELTDEFVKTVSEESSTVEEYKKEIKKTLEENASTDYDSALQDAAWTAVLEKAEVKKYPEEELKEMTDSLIQQYKDAAEYYQMDYEEFIEQQMGYSLEEFEKQVDLAAKESIKSKLVAEVIGEKEKLVPADEDMEKEFEKLAEEYGYESVDALKEAADEDSLKTIVIQNNVKEWLAEHCIQVKND